MQRHVAAACALTVALVAGTTSTGARANGAVPTDRSTETAPAVDGGNKVLKKIRKQRAATRRWERLMGVRPTAVSRAAERNPDLAYRLRVLASWKRKAALRRNQANNPPRLRHWLCIYRHERHPRQGWATHTGNGFYGGLQMNIAFQRTYGSELLRRKGTANRWSAIEQIWVAERAYRSGRGFYPWPNTARYCGLI